MQSWPREAAWETEEPRKRMVKALGRKKKELPDDYFTEENLEVCPHLGFVGKLKGETGEKYVHITRENRNI